MLDVGRGLYATAEQLIVGLAHASYMEAQFDKTEIRATEDISVESAAFNILKFYEMSFLRVVLIHCETANLVKF